MNRFALLTFTLSILLAGCTASTYLMNAPELSPDKEIHQALESWEGTHISESVQRWGSPHRITGEAVGPKIYIWQTAVQTLPPQQEQQPSSHLDPDVMQCVPETSLSINNMYELVFYTRSNGVIYKTDMRRMQNSTGESNWKGSHISKTIREWGEPHGIIDDETGSKIYIWQIPMLTLILKQTHPLLSPRPPRGLWNVIEMALPASHELMFYTNPNDVIYETEITQNQNFSVGSQILHLSEEKPETMK